MMKLPLGYRYAAVYAGIRKTVKDDLALIVSDLPAATAGVFTQNRACAAPVRLCQRHLKISRGTASAILVNAGNANCATRTGEKVAAVTAKAVAKMQGIPINQVLVASTGVIGVELDASLILKALPALRNRLSSSNFEQVSRAIMTTDTRPKTAWAEVELARGAVNLAGMTKGAGMIMPMMATTLGFILTDAATSAATLRGMLREACEHSYNRISVDGDTSTNDTVLLLANGASGNKITKKDQENFLGALTHLMQDLAQQIVRDGEGARKLVTIEVEGARTDQDAARLARTIANSPLVKTAIAGSDPNWGRILCAAGNAGVAFEPSKVDIYFQQVRVCREGLAAPFDEESLTQKLNEKDVAIRFVIRGKGRGWARFWTCDFTEEYIKINGSYRT
ncbi:MAG: bifunctional glutamate N-acetyltransferase/amino-acid acetyltransferase ArgJ [Bryobacteraceae bacterium]|nr:bifunctional glutamate N-acetyltransferase/amino-acid acetyltransferase ArgJ [Bryobacteraceae bacterium]MDW8377987.1 bifunctional glutamate N-acetyltransferase/amino-acid acetyltransferase ArgJ [Bryobacterales bacterium]